MPRGAAALRVPGISSPRVDAPLCSIHDAWYDAGGVYVVANLRGGGEYGEEWHRDGMLESKQNVFDDFIAAGEYLIAEGITPEDGLAIQDLATLNVDELHPLSPEASAAPQPIPPNFLGLDRHAHCVPR